MLRDFFPKVCTWSFSNQRSTNSSNHFFCHQVLKENYLSPTSKFFSFFPFHFTSCRCPASPFDPIVQNMLKNCVSISTGIKPLCSSRGWIVFWEEEYIGLKLFLDCMMKHCTCILLVVQINCYSERRNWQTRIVFLHFLSLVYNLI